MSPRSHIDVWRIVDLRRVSEPPLDVARDTTLTEIGAQLAHREGQTSLPMTVSDVETYYVTRPDGTRVYFRRRRITDAPDVRGTW